jgi:putative ABC transport system permease protein
MAMNWLALRMLTGDRAKYLGLVSAIAFSSMLMSQQMSIFCGLMLRTASVIQDMPGVDIWVTDPKLQNVDEIKPLRGDDLYRVRGVPGVAWAVRLYKGQARVRADDGTYRVSVLLGLDDTSLVGAPVEMLDGSVADLRQPDAVILDDAGFRYLFPGETPRAGKVLEMNDRRALVVGICKASPPFQTFPVVYTRYSLATYFIPRERDDLSFILAGVEPGNRREEICERIRAQTSLQALPREQFLWKTIRYYIASTGIPVNFGITVALGFIVGTAVAGQTFYLFVLENLRHFGALKAMGVADGRVLGMVLLQASVVGALGYAIGMGMTTAFFAATGNLTHLRAFYLPWQVMAGTAAAVGLIIVLASAMAVRRVWVLEPAVVFRG